MNRSAIWLLAFVLYMAPAFSVDAVRLQRDGFELELIEHSSDSKRSSVTWYVTLPDGRPVQELGDSNYGTPRYQITNEQIVELAMPGDSPGDFTFDIRIHGKKPMVLFNNIVGERFNLGQNHISFVVTLILGEEMSYSTNPEPHIPMLDNIYYLVHSITNRPIVRLHLRSFKKTSQLWQVYFANEQQEELVNGMPVGVPVDSSALGLMTEAAVANEVAKTMQHEYAFSPVGF